MGTTDILRRNNVKVFGNGGQTMLFAQGLGCDQTTWRLLTAAFEQDYRIVLFDYVGIGHSDHSAYDEGRYSSLRGYAQDIIDICQALDLNDAIFVGHSVSCMIGMLASINMPGCFSQLIMIAPSPCYLNEGADYQGGFDRESVEDLLARMALDYRRWARDHALMVTRNADRPWLAREVEECLLATHQGAARSFAKAAFLSDNREDLQHVEVPTLILQSAEDAVAPPPIGSYLHAHLQFSTLYQMKATGHCPQLSHPEETRDLILRYLATVPA